MAVFFLLVRYSYLSVLPDDKADVSAASLLIQYFIISNLIINCHCYYILKRYFLNLKGLSDGSVASLTKKEYGSAVYIFLDLDKIFRANV